MGSSRESTSRGHGEGLVGIWMLDRYGRWTTEDARAVGVWRSKAFLPGYKAKQRVKRYMKYNERAQRCSNLVGLHAI